MKSKHKHLLPKLVRWCVPLILILALAIQVPVPAHGSDSYVPTRPKVLTALDQETTGLSIYADPDYGFSLNLLTGWSTLPSFSTGRAPGIGGAAFTSVPWHPQMPSLPVLPGQSSVVISLEDANVPVLGDLMAYLRQSFGWTYMESVGEQVLPNGIQVVEASPRLVGSFS